MAEYSSLEEEIYFEISELKMSLMQEDRLRGLRSAKRLVKLMEKYKDEQME